MINEFQGPYRFLSNFYPAQVVVDGLTFPTVEHAYQASKTGDPTLQMRIYVAESPGEAKRLGRLASRRDLQDWPRRKEAVMAGLVRQKFDHPALAAKLLETGDHELLEGNKWGDTFWGVDLVTGLGDNRLGKILMEVRAELRRKGALHERG